MTILPRRLKSSIIVCAGLFLAAFAARAAQFNVRDYGAKGDGGSNDRPALQRAIDAAGRSGPGSVVLIPRGRYWLTPSGPRPAAHLELSHLQGLTIRGEPGAILDCTDPNANVFHISGSAGIRIESLRLERHPFLYTQGVISSISAADRTVEVAIDPGYDEPDAKYLAKMDFFMVFSDPGTGSWHHDAPWPPLIERRDRISPGHWRLTLSRAPLPAFGGAPFVIWKNLYSGWAFAMADSRDVAVEDVAYYSDGGQAGFVVNHCEGDISFHRFAVTPQPGTNQRFACAGGAMVFNNRIRLVVDDCDFAATDDDGINMGTNSSHVLTQLGPRTLEIEAGRDRGDYRAGDHVALWDWVAKKERLEARVVSVAPSSAGLKVELDHDVQVGQTGVGPWKEFVASHPAGDNSEADRDAKHAARRANEKDGIDRLIDLDDAGTAIIRNSRFQSYRSRNILMKAPNALIENNVFHDTVMASILVGPEFYWDEGPTVRHLVIRNNRFVNVSGSSIVVGAHFSDASYDNRDITIEGNTFVGYGHYGINVAGKQGVPIFIRNSNGVVIKNNDIGQPDPAAPTVPRIQVEVSKEVEESGNRLASPANALNGTVPRPESARASHAPAGAGD